MMTPNEVITYWIDEVGPKGWYEPWDGLDEEITAKFKDAWQEARDGACCFWQTSAEGTLAYIILTDQFPRNMFRGSDQAFATDRAALSAAKRGIDRGWDLKVDGPARQFFYLPLMHSECLSDQDRCVRLMKERMPEAEGNLLHAKAHREVIRQFGRFPYRNDALNRTSTAPEKSYMADGGYGSTMRLLQAS